ncbi:MAG: ABC transporter substrate-binding protein [Proteobacteria bacterium]|nr:ABC transporter substrate-binding protein [Pseudomonadota bacterium]MBU1715973.1 ABC transporter substrate-binding protein [Pseudomonadota bacterium]
MQKITLTITLAISALLLATLPVGAGELTKIRIGWQIPWATQGQLVQVLKHTDILAKNGLQAEFIGRTYGPILNEIALAGEIDVVLTADQPAAALFSKDKGWLGIGRLMYNRTLTYVPPKSAINSLAELKGRTIGIPIGAAAERVTVAALKKAGLDPAKDVKIINLGILEQGPLVLGGENSAQWGNLDALSGFDPTPAIFEAKGLIKVLDVGKVCSLVLMNENFIKENGTVAAQLMQSIFDAYDYYRQNIEQANGWFMAEAGLQLATNQACDVAASIEPNVWVKNRGEIRVTFIEEDFKIMDEAAEFMAPKLKKKVDMRKYVSDLHARNAK